MDFDQIVLTDFEMAVLKDSKTKSVPISQCDRLLRFRLVEEEKEFNQGLRPRALGTCRITQRGLDYLLWSEQKSDKKIANENAKESARERRYKQFQIIIALLALLLSGIAILLDYWPEIVKIWISIVQ